MKDWLARQDPDAPFLDVGERIYSYGETLTHVDARTVNGVEVLRPSLDYQSVVDLLAVMSSGTAVLDPRGSEEMEPGEVASVVYTSGSSDQPKGVLLTRENWLAAVSASVDHLGHGREDVWLLAMPLNHVAGLSIILRSAYAGGSVLMAPGFQARAFAAALRRVTMASVVPTMLQRVLEVDPGPYEGMRAVLVGGGPIPDGLLERAAETGLPVLPTYGMTETCGQVATLKPGSAIDYKADPLPGVEIRLGVDNGIELRAPMLSPGYLGEEPRSSGAWFETGDAGSIDADGALRVLGRLDDLIITGGENVSPQRVEDTLRNVDGVDDVVVVGIESSEWGMEVACLYMGDAGIESVSEQARSLLMAHERPRRIARVDEIPLIGPGKPDRSRARELILSS